MVVVPIVTKMAITFSTEPPTWVSKPKSGVFSVGGSFVLFCEAIGFPEPAIKWKKNGIPLEGKHRI